MNAAEPGGLRHLPGIGAGTARDRPGLRARSATTLLGGGSLIVASLIVASFGACARLVAPMFGPAAQTVIRFGLAAVLVAAVNVTRRVSLRLARRDAARMIALGASSYGLGLALAVSVNDVPLGEALCVLYASSITAAVIIGVVVFGETITFGRVVAAVLALGGLVVYAHGLSTLSTGVLAAAGGGVLDAASNALRKSLREMDRQVAVMWQYGVGAVLAAPVLVASGTPLITSVHAGAAIAMIVFAVASVALGRLLFFAFGHVDMGVGSVLMASQVFWAMLLGFACFGEVLRVHELIGAVLVVAAAAVAILGPHHPSEQIPPSERAAVLSAVSSTASPKGPYL